MPGPLRMFNVPVTETTAVPLTPPGGMVGAGVTGVTGVAVGVAGVAVGAGVPPVPELMYSWAAQPLAPWARTGRNPAWAAPVISTRVPYVSTPTTEDDRPGPLRTLSRPAVTVPDRTTGPPGVVAVGVGIGVDGVAVGAGVTGVAVGVAPPPEPTCR